MQTFISSFSEIKITKRLSPKVYIINNYLNKFQKKNKFKKILLGDKDYLLKITDGEHAGQTFVKEGIKFIKNSDVRDFNIDLSEKFYISIEKHKQLKRSALQKGDVLFTTIGHLGSAAIVPEDFGEANINQNLVIMRIDDNILDKFFLVPYLNSKIVKKQIFAILTGNIHSILTYPKIKSLILFLPDKTFQNQIVKDYKKFVIKEKKSNDLIESAIKIFYENFKNGNDKFKEKIIYKITKNQLEQSDMWNPKNFYPEYEFYLKKIKDDFNGILLENEIADIRNGFEPGSKYYNNYLEKNDDDVPFIRTSDIINSQIDLFPDNFIPKNVAKDFQISLVENDILFTKDGKIGVPAMIVKSDENNAVLSAGITRIRLNKDSIISPQYLFLNLLIKEVGFYQADQKTVIASTLPHLKEDKIKNFYIPIIEKKKMNQITHLIKESFNLKNECKLLIRNIRISMDKYYPI